jgi:outer membrane protein
MNMNKYNQQSLLWLLLAFLLSPMRTMGQSDQLDSANLNQIIEYAMAHQPALKQSMLDEDITDRAIKGKLADWYPQVNFAYNLQHNLELPTTVFAGNKVKIGTDNTSNAQLSATQNLFNRDALLAIKTASDVREQSSLTTERVKIDLKVSVSKAFYEILASLQQIQVTEESITRLTRTTEDAMNRYTAGVADKTDYKRASIQLRNAEASLKGNKETLNYKIDFLKTLIGAPNEMNLSFKYDNEALESEIFLEPTTGLNVNENINYQLLSTQKTLQESSLKYATWAFVPTVSLFGSYNRQFQNNTFSQLYNTAYPTSYIGASVAFPIFQGGKRISKIQEQSLSSERLDVSIENLENSLNTEYTRAMSAYNSNLTYYQTQKENVDVAQEVYEVIQAQYQNGIRTYLDVIIAESDLQTTKINYYNALYTVLSSKMDVMKVLGQINY